MILRLYEYLLFRRPYAMRKQLLLILMLSLILAVTACRMSSGGGAEVDENGKATFQATILEVRDGY